MFHTRSILNFISAKRLLRSRIFFLFAIALLYLAYASRSEAKVFTRWKSASKSNKAIESIGGKHAYSADMNINGAPADLVVYGFDDTVENLCARFKHLFPSAHILTAGGGLAVFNAEYNKNILRMVLIQTGAPGTAVAVKLEQDKDSFLKSLSPPERNLLPAGIAELPGSSRIFFAANNETGMSIGTYRASTDPLAIHAYYEARLSGDGWEPLLTNKTSMRVFLKNEQFCCVMVAADNYLNESTITIIHKVHERQ